MDEKSVFVLLAYGLCAVVIVVTLGFLWLLSEGVYRTCGPRQRFGYGLIALGVGLFTFGAGIPLAVLNAMARLDISVGAVLMGCAGSTILVSTLYMAIKKPETLRTRKR